MNAELVKRQDRWDLYGEDGSKIASSAPNPMRKLSIKNCEAIENGYDLDELAEKHYNGHIKRGHTEEDSLQRKIDFTIGFVSALEILGDKKFSEEDMKKAMNKIVSSTYSNKGDDIFDLFLEINRKKYIDEYIQSLQQTEWDVRVVMCCGLPDGCTEPEVICPSNCEIVPLLDADGCIVLKRI